MANDLLCTWLQLPPGTWPPDHYTLLGLEPGPCDAAVVEQHVHERMEIVRRYQLLHPEAATEAMNRLAQALICLTDPRNKRDYDLAHFPDKVSVEAAAEAIPTGEPVDPLAWLFGPLGSDAGGWEVPAEDLPKMASWETAPPPERAPVESDRPTVTDLRSDTDVVPTEPEAPDHRPEPAPPTDPAVEAARAAELRRGLGTRHALYQRISRVRQLRTAWEEAGRIIGRPSRILSRASEASRLIQAMEAARELVAVLPPLVGAAGQPGYLVLTLARQQAMVPTLQTLLPSQRQALARDWQAGLAALNGYLFLLRQELKVLQRRGWLNRLARAAAAGIADHPGRVLLLVGVVALNVAFDRVRHYLDQQVIALSVIMGLWLLYWWRSVKPVRIETPRPPAPQPRPQTTMRARRPAKPTRT